MLDITSVPHYQQILCEEDIVGEKASIAYEKNLRKRSLYVCYGPLQVCWQGHSLWMWNFQPIYMFGMQARDFMLATNILLSDTVIIILHVCSQIH